MKQSDNETKRTGKDPERLKAVWEELMQRQTAAFDRRRTNKCADSIASVRIVSDEKGGKQVQIDTVGGARVQDSGDKSAVFTDMAQHGKSTPAASIAALVEEVRQRGFDTVADQISAETMQALRVACINAGVSLYGDGDAKKNETEKAREAAEQFNRQEVVRHSRKPAEHKPPQTIKPFLFMPASVKAETSLTLASARRAETNTHRAQAKLYAEKNKLFAEINKRLQQEKAALRQKYSLLQIDEYRQELFGLKNKAALIREKLEKGQPLTAAEQKLWNRKQTLGIEADPKNETLTLEQKQARNKMSIRDLSQSLQKDYKTEITRKQLISNAKRTAVDIAVAQKSLELAYGKKADVSRAALEESAVKVMLPREKLETPHLQAFCQKQTKLKGKISDRIEQVKEQRKQAVAAKLQEEMARNASLPLQKRLTKPAKDVREPFSKDLLQRIKAERQSQR